MDRLVFLATPVGLLLFLLVGDCYQRVIVEPGDPFDIAVSLAWESVSAAGFLDELSSIFIHTADP